MSVFNLKAKYICQVCMISKLARLNRSLCEVLRSCYNYYHFHYTRALLLFGLLIFKDIDKCSSVVF